MKYFHVFLLFFLAYFGCRVICNCDCVCKCHLYVRTLGLHLSAVDQTFLISRCLRARCLCFKMTFSHLFMKASTIMLRFPTLSRDFWLSTFHISHRSSSRIPNMAFSQRESHTSPFYQPHGSAMGFPRRQEEWHLIYISTTITYQS